MPEKTLHFNPNTYFFHFAVRTEFQLSKLISLLPSPPCSPSLSLSPSNNTQHRQKRTTGSRALHGAMAASVQRTFRGGSLQVLQPRVTQLASLVVQRYHPGATVLFKDTVLLEQQQQQQQQQQWRAADHRRDEREADACLRPWALWEIEVRRW